MESITSLMGLSANEIGNPHLTLTEFTNFDKFVLNHFANHCNPQSQTNGLSEMSIWKKNIQNIFATELLSITKWLKWL